MLPWLVLLALLVALSALLWRRGRSDPPAPAGAAAAGAAADRSGWRGLLPLSPERRLTLWLQDAAPAHAAALPVGAAAEISAWAAALTPHDAKTWERDVRAFGQRAGVKLDWLWGRVLDHDPDLRADLGVMVLLYCLSYSRARGAAATMAAVQALQEWQAKPGWSRQRRFGDALHTALVRRGLISIDPELFVAPARRRRREAIAAIKRLDAERHTDVRATVVLMLAGAAISPLPAPRQEPPPPPAIPPSATVDDEATHGDQLPALDPSAA